MREMMRTPMKEAPMQHSPNTSANCALSRCEKPNDSAADEEEKSTCAEQTPLRCVSDSLSSACARPL